MKRIQNSLFALSFIAFSLLPVSWSVKLGQFFGWFLRRLVGYRQKQVRLNLDIAFGEGQWTKDLERKIYQNFGLLIVELFRYPRKSIEQATSEVTAHNIENLQGALALGKGAIIVTGHFGHWEQSISTIAAMGIEVGLVVKDLHSVDDEYLYKRIRTDKNINVIRKKKAAVEIMRILKRGGVVCMVIDQHAKRTEGTQVKFFGKECMTFAAPAVFAAKTGAPIVPGIAWRDEDLRSYHIKTLDAIHITKDEMSEEAIQLNMQKMTSTLERELRKKPEDWIWMHDRWKTRPRKKRK